MLKTASSKQSNNIRTVGTLGLQARAPHNSKGTIAMADLKSGVYGAKLMPNLVEENVAMVVLKKWTATFVFSSPTVQEN